MAEERQFPILGEKGTPRSIPWRVLAPHEAHAQRNHYQSLERLAERGGLSWVEAYAVLKGIRLYDIAKGQQAACRKAVLNICEKEHPHAD